MKDSWEDDDEVVEILPTVKKTNISSEADEVFAEKKRLEGLVMKSDLNAACDLFGIQKPKEEPKVLLVGKAKEATSNKVYDENCLDKLQLHTKQDFDYFSSHLTTNLTRFDESKFYLPFLEMTISKLVQTLSPMDIKKLGTVLNNAAAAKQKQIAEAQSKGKKKGNKLVLIY